MLSGFIIYYTTFSKPPSVGSFVTKRFIRIYPIYWVVTLLLIAAYFLSPSPSQAHKADPLVIAGSLLLWPQEKYVVGVAWTLTYEIVFYLVFAFTFLRKPIYLLYAFAVWITASLLCAIFSLKTGFHAIDSLLDPIVINFALGCVVAYVFTRLPSFRYGNSFLVFGAFAFAAAWLIYQNAVLQDASAFTHLFSRVCLFGLPSAIFIFGCLYVNTRMPGWLVYLGDASYSIYLIHGTVLVVSLKLAGKLNFSPLLNNFSGATFLFLFTIAVGGIFHTWVEKPISRFMAASAKTKKTSYANAS